MAFETISFEISERIAHLHLNRPQAQNAIDAGFTRDLRQAGLALQSNAEVGAILITASGKNFCVGGDLKFFYSIPRETREGEGLRLTSDLHSAVSLILGAGPPVVTAVQGVAAGAGFALACASDLTLAASDARFSVAYTGVALTPDTGCSYFLPRVLGYKRAMELLLTNRVLNASEALAEGLITQIVAPEVLFNEARALALRLAQGPQAAIRAARQLLRESTENTLETQLENEARQFARSLGSEAADEGMRAFLEKRKPDFGGRK